MIALYVLLNFIRRNETKSEPCYLTCKLFVTPNIPTFQYVATSTTQYFLQIFENKHLSISNLPISIWIWNPGNADMKNGNILLSTVYTKLRKNNSRLENIEINKCTIDGRWHSIWFNS